MVRTSRPLVERMTLVWHDWFATSNDGVGNQKLMIKQNELFRFHALGSFHRLLLDVTKDPAMLLWLNGTENVKDAPNENYAREMMELFTLGADRGAYTERDVREQARVADRLAEQLEAAARATTTSTSTRSEHDDGHEDGLPQGGPLRLAGRVPALRLALGAPVVLRQQALELLRPGCRRAADARRRSRRSTGRATRSRRSSARSSSTRRCSTGRGW